MASSDAAASSPVAAAHSVSTAPTATSTAATPGAPRLIIRRMVMENFKSYGGVKSIGPFHKSFSPIVGPNGSGKSNVIDAMLFVFGKRANKLRQSKVADLIHRSAAYPDLDFASVAVHFCEITEGGPEAGEAGDGSVEVPGSAMVVERRAFRNNTSRYYVDGKGASQKEVTDLLRAKGIDLDHNRFLILQGEVEQISLMKPKGATEHETGLLEYLEDIIGSNRFVDDIAASFAVVDALSTERDEKLNRVRVADKSRQELAQAREDALSLLRCDYEVRRRKAELLQVKAHSVAERLEEVRSRRAGFDERRATEQARLDEAETAAKAAREQADALGARLEEAEKAVRALDEEFSALEKRDITVREARAHCKGRVKKLAAVVKAQRTKAAEAKEAKDGAEASKPELEAEMEGAEAQQAEAEEEVKAALANLRSATAGLRTELNERQAALAPVAERRAHAAAAVDKLEAEASMLRQGAAQATAEADRLSKEKDRAARELSAGEAAASKAEAERDATRGRLDEAKSELAEVKAGEAAASRAAAAARAVCEEGKAAAERAAGQGRVVQRLLAACKPKAEMEGVRLYGRLGDLGSVDASLDVAVSTAAGALDWLVVESTADGQRCIEYLRKHSLGRAKFLILDKQGAAAAAMDRELRLPAGGRRLFDLITPDEDRFRPAFFFALRNTLVADDIDAAAAMAYRGSRAEWRVVTLKGELIDTSGTMSGGGGRPRTGLIRTSGASGSSSSSSARAASAAGASARGGGVSAADIREAEKTLRAASEEAAGFRDRALALTREVRALETQLRAQETGARKARAAVQAMTERLEELEVRTDKAVRMAADAREREETAAERAAEVEEELAAARAALAVVDEEASSLKAAVEELEGSIQEAGGARLEAAKARAKELAAQVASNRKAATKAGVDLKAAAKNLAKAEAAEAAATEEMERLLAQLEETKSEKEEVVKEAERVTTLRDAATEAVKAARAEAAAADTAAADAEKAVKRLARVLEEVEEGMAEVVKASKDLEHAAKDLDKKLDSVRRMHAASIEGIPLDDEDDEDEEDEEGEEAEEEGGEAGAGARAAAAAGSDSDSDVDSDEDAEEGAASDAGPASSSSSGSSAAARKRTPKRRGASLAAMRELPVLSAEDCEAAEEKALERAVAVAEEAARRQQSGVNVRAIAEYSAKNREYVARAAELDQVSSKRDAARKEWDALRKQRLEVFMAGFRAITLKLKEMYRMITLGGDAELELVDSLDPFSEGILFTVRPPKKSWKRMANLSGGEKTLSSLALVFALHHFKPTPLYVMDEIDAALDFKNVSVVAHYLKQRTDMAQFIIISLRNNMFELADRLVGIYKTHDVTKSVTIDPKRFAAAAGVPTGAEEAEARIAAGKASASAASPGPALADRTNV